MAALQKAFHSYVDRGERAAAARCAWWLGMIFASIGEPALAAGWTSRAERLLDELDEDVVERGYVSFLLMFRHIAAQEWATAFEYAADVTAYGRRYADPDLLALGLSGEGRMVIYAGRVPDGLALLDEAMLERGRR